MNGEMSPLHNPWILFSDGWREEAIRASVRARETLKANDAEEGWVTAAAAHSLCLKSRLLRLSLALKSLTHTLTQRGVLDLTYLALENMEFFCLLFT